MGDLAAVRRTLSAKPREAKSFSDISKGLNASLG